MDKIKKYLGFLVFPLLFLMMLFPVGEAHAATDITSKVKIDNLKITIASTGSETEGIHGSNDTLMKLKYSGKFSFPNVAANEIKDGDYFIVKAPNNLSLTDGSLDLIDSTSNIKMGTVQVDNANHRLVFTFNDKVKDKQNIRGDFVAEATETLQKEGKTVTYVLPDGKKQTITYKVNTYQQTDVIGETITKYGYNDNNKAIAHFQMKINRAKKDMTGHVVKITDDVSKGAFANYVEGTFYMHEAEFETTNTNSSALKHLGDEYEITTDPEVYKANSDKKALLTFVNGKRGFELLMPTNMGTKSFFLTYDTSSPADTSMISNSAQYLIDNQPQLIWENYGGSIGTRTEATFNLKTVKSVGASVTADIAGKIKITKYDEADATVKLAGVVFEIREKTTNNLVDTVTTDADGIAVSKALNNGKYIVKEKTPKSGYQVNSQEFEVEMKDGKGVPLNISNKRVTVDFEATKTWVNGKATDYKKVKLGLYVHKEGQTVADAKPVTGNYTPEVTESNGVYTYKWLNRLPKYDVDGKTELVYSVRELQDTTELPLKEGEKVKVGDNSYVVSYNGNNKVTNTYEVPKTNVTAKKIWVGGQEYIRPTVYFKLYRTPEGGAIEEVAGAAQKEVPKTDGTVEWTDLPATDEHGVKYTYSVMEVDEDGNLVTAVDGYTANQTADLTVTNTYGTSPTKVDIEVKKELVGGRPTPLQNEEFEFILKDKNGQEVQRAKNDAAGCVVFKDIPFDKAGEYEFTVVEVNAGQTIDGVTYDVRTVPVTVSVTDDGKGKLVATVLYHPITAVALPSANLVSSAPSSNLVPSLTGAVNRATDSGIQTFKNTYKATNAKAVLEVTKQLTGRTTGAQENEFEFTLTDQVGNVETKRNDADGKVKFHELTFDEAGTYTYTIKEVKAGTTENGITYDSKTVTAKVTVTDDGHGKLTAVVSYDNDERHFENTYKAANAKANLEVTKKLTGRELKADEFEFTLTDQDGNVKETVKNDKDGNVKFSELEFDKAGTYTYKIAEKAGTATGIQYDTKTITATVTVADNGKGVLEATVAYDGEKVFENTYTPAGATSVTLGAKKVLEGKNLEAGKYSFVLKEGDKELETVTNAADGTVTFSPISYDESQVGTHKYTISEVGGSEAGITYDKTVQEVEVTVEKVSATELKATASKEAKDLVFTNKYTPAGATSVTLGAKKVLEGKNLEAGKYSFVLKEGDKELETVTNAADGSVTFSPISYDESQVGTHKYTISEVAGSETGITYDKTVQEVEVTVEKVSATELKATASKEAKDLVFTNTYTPAGATSVTLGAKKVLEGKDLEAGKYSFELKKEDGSVVETVKNAADGTVTFSPISYDESQVGTHKYTISEVAGSEAGITYDKTVQEVEVTVEKVSATELKATASKEAKDLVFTNTYTPAKTSVSVTKKWDDKNNQDGKRPASVTVKLLADGQDTGKTLELNAANNWAGSFTDLDADKGGTSIQYTVVEVTVPGYTSEVTGDAASGFTITNSYSPETVDVKATKNWDDANNQDGKRPTKITINLLADGQKVDSKEVQAAADGTWTVEFTKLAKYKAGKEIKYTVTEEAVAEYESTITDFTITNKYAPKEIDYKVTKVWNDANNQDGKRPESVTVQLFKSVGGSKPVAVEGKKLILTAKDKTDANTWVASFTNLPQYEAGKEITYSIDEVDVPAGYEASVTGQVVTNTHDVETVVLSGTKVWDDNNNQDGKRTKSVKVQIFKGEGEKAELVQEIEVSEKTGWKFESKKLPKYENGQEIKYTVKEVAVASYETTITSEKDGKYTITNKHTPEKTTVKGKKIWNDENNKDGIRPDSIKVKLLADGKETVQEATVSEATGWTYEFTGLERYKDTKGTEFKYSVVEVPVDGYTSEVIGTNIVNHHKPKDPEPNKPQNPEPNKPKDPEPGKPGPKPQLPNTGEKSSNAAVVAGLALMSVTSGLYFVSRKNK
ncbi:Cna B-type domain-containing protein [Streptococcus sp. CCUG 71758]|uniref:Cna B-type domain-containing protein n=1 Tax=Streptococcus sp. CCUG 71758 TaxID=2496638 RepID=UPI001423560D|nr:Cna B-type domain-containing protein [Streptococcus sp. CCUG 71758]NIB83986.1 Cna B-type domain-containing protein [Streptococcus sp. CCUG 71758]